MSPAVSSKWPGRDISEHLDIRPATPADAGAICAIWNPIIADTLITFTTEQKSPGDIAALVAARAAAALPFWVAEDDSGVVGFASYSPFRSGPGYARTMEHTVLLAPSGRGRGVGRKLLQALEESARNAGVRSLIAGVSSANPGAVAFHLSCGFAQIATLPEVGTKQGRWLDLVLLQKLL